MMIKRIKFIIVTVLLIAFLFPASALANDGGAMMDDKGFLTIKATPLSKECAIGEEFLFSLTLINNTKHPIEAVRLYEVFNDVRLSDFRQEDYKWGDFNADILAGEKVELTVKTTVPPYVKWYKKGDSFYTDFCPKLLYFAYFENEDKLLLDWHFVHPDLKPVPIKITNIHDGEKLIKLNVFEKETTFYFPEHQRSESYTYEGELYSKISNELYVTNISNYEIDNVYISNQSNLDYDEMSLDLISPYNTYNVKTYDTYFIAPENLPKTLPSISQVNFKCHGKYYGVKSEKDYPAVFLKCPELKLSYSHSKNALDEGSYSIVVENQSNTDYEYLYADFTHSGFSHESVYSPYEDAFYSENQIIPTLLKKSTVEISSLITPDKRGYYFIGLLRDGKLYFWNVDFESNSVFFREVYDTLYYSIKRLNEELLLSPTPTPTFTPKPSPTPTVTPKLTPAPSPTASPTPLSTSAPTNTTTPSPTEEPTIEVVEVKKSSSIPFWVWYVLAVAVIGAIALIITIRKKKGDDKLKYE